MLILILPDSLRTQLICDARAAFPAEACGLLEGEREGDIVTVTAVRPAANVSAAPGDSFIIDPAAQFALQRALRGTGRTVVGCFHSHPDGLAEPSPRDRENGCDKGFVWVIIATGVNEALRAFEGPSFQPLTIQGKP